MPSLAWHPTTTTLILIANNFSNDASVIIKKKKVLTGLVTETEQIKTAGNNLVDVGPCQLLLQEIMLRSCFVN